MVEFNSDDHYIYYCRQETLRRNGVAAPPVLWCVRGTCFPHPHYKHHRYVKVDIFSYIYQPFVYFFCESILCVPFAQFFLLAFLVFSFICEFFMFFVTACFLSYVQTHTHTHSLTSGFSPC